MKYPQLVRDCDCKTDITLKIYTNGISEDGEPITAVEKNLKCNYQSTGQKRYDSEHQIVEIHSVALLNGDAISELEEVSNGVATILGVERRIYKCSKERNPDGTVNYTRIEFL